VCESHYDCADVTSVTASLMCVPISWGGSVRDLVAGWPVGVPLLALVSDDPEAWNEPERRSRWSYFAAGDGARVVVPGRATADEALSLVSGVLEGGRSGVVGVGAGEGQRPPFIGGWIGALAYELGHSLEPASGRACARDPETQEYRASTPQAIFTRCDAVYAHDAVTGRWWVAGAAEGVERLPALGRVGGGDGASRVTMGRPRSRTGRARYEAAVAHAVRAIHEGELFQANLTHELRARFEGEPRALFRSMLDSARPAFGAYLEYPGARRVGCVLSVSPELFVSVEPSGSAGARRICTRPIKGTRAARAGAGAELLHSRKDEAELAMITDLMRNDLGRVCAPGTVRVDDGRLLERCGDGALLHTVSAVSGRLREGVSDVDVLRATFPPGSVTGAPKVRAMQLIRALEGRARGFYCGAIGAFSDDGHVALSVAIRTATVRGERMRGGGVHGTLEFPVGAGIVADSDARAEWEETMAKASVLGRVRGDAGRQMGVVHDG